jgi:hypothetical protein
MVQTLAAPIDESGNRRSVRKRSNQFDFHAAWNCNRRGVNALVFELLSDFDNSAERHAPRAQRGVD